MAKAEKVEKEEVAAAKYGIEDLAALFGIGAASVRVWLRNNEVERTGRSYGWNTKAELDALVKSYKEGKAKPAAEEPAPKAAKATKKKAA